VAVLGPPLPHPAFVHLAKRITAIRGKIHATLDHRLSNALIESVNTKIRLLTRLAFGFRSADALIALAMLSLAGLDPSYPAGQTHGSVSRDTSRNCWLPESVNLYGARPVGVYCACSFGWSGRLIQAVVGSFGGCGGLRTNRSGCAA
jgi:hypothetical protein